MNKYSALIISLFVYSAGFAQTPEDALRYGFPLTGGTARVQAIGGAVASLGGDISAAHVNPAGLGLFKNNEVVLSPHFVFRKNDYNYLGTSDVTNKSNIGYGTSGLVFAHPVNSKYRKVTASAFAITVNTIANYKNYIEYSGLNNNSSWSEQYIEQLVGDRANIGDADNNYIFGSSLAFRSFLIDTLANADGELIGYQSLVPVGNGANGEIQQTNRLLTSGMAHEIALSAGKGYNDKFHVGVSLGIPIYAYTKEQQYIETDISGNNDNDFASFEYNENYRTTGAGFNLKFGLIARPVERLRLGLAIHTPTFATLTDVISSSITTNSENYISRNYPNLNIGPIVTVTSDELVGNSVAGTYRYSLSTPYRLIGSFSYVLNEVNDIKRQRGFITADVEYINYRSTRYSAIDDGSFDDVAYYEELNDIIKERYKGALNIRVGGEVKFNTIMARLGFAHLGSPYAIKGLQANRTLLSGGLGYRYGSLNIDAAYVHGIYKQSQVPYYLNDKANPIADGTNTRGQISITVGIKI